MIRRLARMLMALAMLALTIAPLPAHAEEHYENVMPDEASTEMPAEEEPPPPRTFVVNYESNGGEGAMEASVFTEGQPAPLSKCTFVRPGYTFEGWATQQDGGGARFIEADDIASFLTDDVLTLYAQWGSQIYRISYVSGVSPEHSFPVSGAMQSQLAVHDAEVALMSCGFERPGYTAKGWMDSNGSFHEFEERGTNFSQETTTSSWKLADIDIAQVRPDPSPDWTCQGSAVFRNDKGELCAAVAYVLFYTGYAAGDLSNYDSELMVVNLDTGELINHVSGLMLEHANDLAYCPDNGHLYVAMGGISENYPDGIVELDENLNEVRTITPEGTHNIWNITYSQGTFYAIGNVSGTAFARGNPQGETSDLIRMDADLNVLDVRAIDYSPKGFTGQGMVCDGEYLYSIIYNSSELDAGTKQRLVTFTLEGEARGNQYLDMPGEVESGSALDGNLYFSTNRRTGATIFGTSLAGTTMTTVWKPNAYTVTFDANGTGAYELPQSMQAEYDSTFALPADEPWYPLRLFESWNTMPDGSGISYMPGDLVSNLAESGTTTLYAQWREPTFGLVGDNGRRVRGRRFRSANQPEPRAARPADKQGSVEPHHAARMAALFVALVWALGTTGELPAPSLPKAPVKTRRALPAHA